MSRELIEKIERLKSERNAVILAHNYQIPEVQDIADYTGDSLGLSRQAAETDADVIVFCGVLFMAETAAILSPDKTVLLPDLTAGCPMADMITAEALQKMKDEHPDALVVSYVNSPAEVKALSDYCCTSGNAIELVRQIPEDKEILFVPDKYLGKYVNDTLGRNMLLWPGYCPTHARMDPEDILRLQQQMPDAVVMCHPECPDAIKDVSDQILSTGQMLTFVRASSAQQFIVATELGINYTLKVQNPEKAFHPVAQTASCINMKKITLEKVAFSLEDMTHVINVPEDIRVRARGALDRMLEVLPN